MSAASFISLAGGLYLQGYSGSGRTARRSCARHGVDRWLLPGCAVCCTRIRARLNLYTLPDYFSASATAGVGPV